MEFLRVWKRIPLSACTKGFQAPSVRIQASMKSPLILQSGSIQSTSTQAVALLYTSQAPQTKQNLVSNLQMQKVRKYSDQNKLTALVAFKDLKHLKSSPLPALVLGLSGLVPFVMVPSTMIIGTVFCPTLAFAQVAYGASILSFMGGIRWGFSIAEGSTTRPDWRTLGYSVAPALIAWSGLLLPITDLSILALTGGLAWTVYVDAATWGYPPWFKALRFVLSFVAILSLWTTLVCKYILSDAKAKKLKAVKKNEAEKVSILGKEMPIANMETGKDGAATEVSSRDG